MFTLQTNEKVNTYVRKHWLVIAVESFGLIVIALLPVIVIFFADLYLDISITHRAFTLALIFYLIWLLFIWIGFFLAWTDYYLDVWVLTNQRIIDIEQKGIFNREVSGLRLDKIQDITVEVEGVLATLLSFGNIRVQTAGQNENIMLKDVDNPYHIKDIIPSLQTEAARH